MLLFSTWMNKARVQWGPTSASVQGRGKGSFALLQCVFWSVSPLHKLFLTECLLRSK